MAEKYISGIKKAVGKIKPPMAGEGWDRIAWSKSTSPDMTINRLITQLQQLKKDLKKK